MGTLRSGVALEDSDWEETGWTERITDSDAFRPGLGDPDGTAPCGAEMARSIA